MKPLVPHPVPSSGNGSQELYSVKWNNYPDTVLRVIRKYLRNGSLTDVTLCCDGGKSIDCHRILLAACSTYFEDVLAIPHVNSHSPAVFFFRGMEFWELEALVAFMYFGEVRVEREKLAQLVKAAASLQIKGLAPETDFDVDDEEADSEYSFPYSPEIDTSKSNTSKANPTTQARPKHVATKRKLSAPHAPSRKMPKTGINGGTSKVVHKGSTGIVDKLAAGCGGLTEEEQELLCKYEQEALKGWSKEDRAAAGLQTPEADEDVEQEGELGPVVDSVEDPVDDGQETESAEEGLEENDEVDEDPAISSDDEGEEGEEVDEIEQDEGDDPDEEDSIAPGSGIITQEPKRRSAYDREFREQVLTALQSGMTLRECSEMYKIPRKTLSKWKQREAGSIVVPEEPADADRVKIKIEPRSPPKIIPKSQPQAQAPVTKMKRGPGVSIDTGDRAERLQKAMILALGGTTVRQAAAQYEIPRTTLCAYMKRHGVTAKRTFINKRKAAGAKDGTDGTSANMDEEDFPFLGGFANLVGGIENPDQDEFEEEEEEDD